MDIHTKDDLTNDTVDINIQKEYYLALKKSILPLLFQNKTQQLEKLLDSNVELQLEFLKLIDKVVGKEIDLSSVMYSCNIKNIKGLMSPKILYKLGLRLLKKYTVDTNLCPHIMYRCKLNSLKYLFGKCYEQRELSIDSLILFAIELSEEDDNLKSEILSFFVQKRDIFSGFIFMEKVNVPQDRIPHILTFKCKAGELEEIKKLHTFIHSKKLKNYFYPLSISFSSVHQIENIQAFNSAFKDLQSYSILGIDTEWKPSLQFDKKEKLMLIQIATYHKVYLFDMLSLKNELSSDHFDKIGKLFSNSNIIKLTYGFTADKRCLADLHFKLKDHLGKISNVIDLNETKKMLMTHHPQFFSYINNKENKLHFKGLSEMVFLCFGKPLDKMEQCSYWSVRPLSPSQVVYAALDAYCLLDIYDYLEEMSQKLDIPDWTSINFPPTVSSKSQDAKAKLSKNNKNKDPQPTNFMPEIPASSLKVVCDAKFKDLGKLLRSCNIDTEILATCGDGDHKKCIEYFEKDSRVILTRRKVHHQIRENVPRSHLIFIKSHILKIQLKEVVKTLGVVIEEKDLFIRCCECNCDKFITFDSQILSKAKKCKEHYSKDSSYVSIIDEKYNFKITDIVTFKGLKVCVEEVPDRVLNFVPHISVCSSCGKCFWNGTYRKWMRANIFPVIRH